MMSLIKHVTLIYKGDMSFCLLIPIYLFFYSQFVLTFAEVDGLSWCGTKGGADGDLKESVDPWRILGKGFDTKDAIPCPIYFHFSFEIFFKKVHDQSFFFFYFLSIIFFPIRRLGFRWRKIPLVFWGKNGNRLVHFEPYGNDKCMCTKRERFIRGFLKFIGSCNLNSIKSQLSYRINSDGNLWLFFLINFLYSFLIARLIHGINRNRIE